MPVRPAISRPCPLRDRIEQVMDGDHCRHCDTRVVDLDSMAVSKRLAWMAAQRDHACVRFRAAGTSLAAAALAAGVIAVPNASAQDSGSANPQATDSTTIAADEEIIVGTFRRLTPAEQRRAERAARRAEQRERKRAERQRRRAPE